MAELPEAFDMDSPFLLEGPISDPATDLFHFNDAVKVTVRFFSECPAPLLFAVYGRSGSGRTSFLRLMEGALKDDPELIQIHFSARPFRTSTNVVRALLRRLEVALSIDDPRFQNIKRTAAAAPEPADVAFDDWVDAIDRLRSDLEEIVRQSLAKAGKSRLLLSVDDLDLCNARIKIQLIEFAAEFLGIDSLIFVMTVDRKQLISDYLAANIFVAERQASLYLERIFPHSYTIPWIGEDHLIDYVVDALDRSGLLNLDSRGARRFRRMVEVYLRRAAVTPVKLVRELAKFARMHIIATGQSCELPHALFAIAIKSQFPEVYRFLLDKGSEGHADLKRVFNPDEDFSQAGFTVRYGRRLDRMLADAALRDLFIAYDSTDLPWETLLAYLNTAAFVPSPY